MDALVNKPNHVPEMQRRLQNDHRLIHQRLPRAKLYMRGYLMMFTVGLFGAVYGTVNMARGVGKIPKKDDA